MRKKTLVKFICATVFIDVVLCLLYFNAYNYLVEMSMESFESYSSTAVYSAISESADKDDFSAIYDIKTDNGGKIVFIGTDAFYANTLSYSLAGATYKKLAEYAERGVQVPAGAFTGIGLISGVGKAVNMKAVTVTSVKCCFLSEMESAGINQVRQRLYITVEPQIKIVIGWATKSKSESIRVLCFDNLIVGDVPDVFLQNKTAVGGQYYSAQAAVCFFWAKNL